MTAAQLAAEQEWLEASLGWRRDDHGAPCPKCGALAVRPVWTREGVVVACVECGRGA